MRLITEGDLRKALFRLALPAMAMMLGNLLFEIVDMFWIGKTSATGIAAVAVASYLIWALRAMANITSGGTTTLISRCAGSRNWDRLSHWFWRGFSLAIIYSLALMALGFLTLEPVVRYMNLESEVLALAEGYLSIFYLSLPLVFLFVFFDGIFRSLGDTLTPAVVTVFSLALNAVLDPILIFGWLGAPLLGVPGAAVATALAQAAGVALYIRKLNQRQLVCAPGMVRYGLLRDNLISDLVQMTRIGVPVALTGTLFSIVYIFLTRIVSQFGTAEIAAMGIGQRWEGLAYFACIAASTAVATVVGQNLGAGNVARARQAAYLSTRYLMAFTFLISLLFIFFGDALASLLTSDAAVIEAADRYLMIIGFFEVAMALELGLEGAFIGSGNTSPPFFISVPLTLARIPVAWFLAIQLGMGIDAVWWTISASTLLKGCLMGAWFLMGRWAHVKVRV